MAKLRVQGHQKDRSTRTWDSKLYFGDGECYIEDGERNIKAILINFSGTVEIEDKTSDDFILKMTNSKILIVPIGFNSTLGELFTYRGTLDIWKVQAWNIKEKIPIGLVRLTSYAEFLDSNADDLDLMPEELDISKSTRGILPKKTRKINNKTINNLRTVSGFYLKDNTPYVGFYHVHIDTGVAMTGAEHSQESKDLYKYIKNIKNAKKTVSLVKTGSKPLPNRLKTKFKADRYMGKVSHKGKLSRSYIERLVKQVQEAGAKNSE